MSTTAMCAAGIACAVVLMGLFIWLVLENHKKDLQLAEKDKTIEHKNQFICRLLHELYKEKGISWPFVMPAEEPEQGPDFDVKEVFPEVEKQEQEDM